VTEHEAPASIGQRLLWMIDHYRAGYSALSCPVLVRLHGPLDAAALATAVDGLCARHESLRTTFEGSARRLVQRVHPPRPVPLRAVDLSATADPAALDRAIAEDLRTRVDPTSWPVRATLWRVAADDHVLCLNMHHLVSDAWSCGVLFGELRQLYEGAPLGPVGWQYRRFAQWQHDLINGDGLHRHREYWARQLAGASLPDLPVRTNGAATEPRGSAVTAVDLGRGVVDALRQLAREQRTTLFAVLLAVYYAQLHRATGQRDLTVASLFANRSRQEVRGTVGFLANMVLLRTPLPAAGSFLDLVRQTHGTVVSAFIYQDLPYQMLPFGTVRTGALRPDDAVFQIMADPGYRVRAAGVDFELLVPDGIGSRFRFELALVPQDGGFRAVLFHDRDWIEPAWAAQFTAGYAELAAAVAGRPTATLAALRA
jgi:Condensation domain